MEKHIDVFGVAGDDRFDTFVPPSRSPEIMDKLLPSVHGGIYKGRLDLLCVEGDMGRYEAADGRRIWLRPDTQGRNYSPTAWTNPAGEQGEFEEATPDVVVDDKPAMTYAEALQAGYRPSGTALQRGYVSRLADPDDAEVHVAGGTRHGQLYVLLNNPRSNQYCIRKYLRRDET